MLFGLHAMAISVFLDLNSGAFQRKDLRLFQPTEWVIPSAGFFSKTSECDALVQNGAFFMELDAAAIMESINKGSGINPDVIGAINSNRRFALVYKGEIVAKGSRYDKAYQKVLQELKKVSYSSEKVKEILEIKYLEKVKLWETIDEVYPFHFNGNDFATAYDIRLKSGGSRPRAGVAYAEGSTLIFELNIDDALQGQGLGTEIFKRAIEDYAPLYVKGIWKKIDIYTHGESINLIEFNKALKNGFLRENAAFETPTGKILQKNGFDGTVEFIKITKEEVIVLFNKNDL